MSDLPIAMMLEDADYVAERCNDNSVAADLYCHVRALAAEVERLESDNTRLRGVIQDMANQIAAQSEILSRRAEKEDSK